MKYERLTKGVLCVLFTLPLAACGKVLLDLEKPQDQVQGNAPSFISLEEVALLISGLPIGPGQMEEVRDAAVSSALNGYDDEYRMRDLFAAPGSGVGEEGSTKAGKYSRPLRDMLREAVLSTKASGGPEDAWLDSLAASDVQIYWPDASGWDGETLPIITFDPGDGSERNEGYALQPDSTVRKVMVDEQMAFDRPVWVINRNSDAEYRSIEMLRREDPSWGSGGGGLIVKSGTELKTLVLRSFRAMRQYDSWFSGGAEFFVKLASIEDFNASTEPELRLYEPAITDFMIVVRRSQVGEELPFNAVLVSDWSEMLTNCAFMITEDDGGTRSTWKCNAVVKWNSKNYGFEVELPLNSRDDIVWRGSLARSYVEKYSGIPVRYGDVELVLELI